MNLPDVFALAVTCFHFLLSQNVVILLANPDSFEFASLSRVPSGYVATLQYAYDPRERPRVSATFMSYLFHCENKLQRFYLKSTRFVDVDKITLVVAAMRQEKHVIPLFRFYDVT